MEQVAEPWGVDARVKCQDLGNREKKIKEEEYSEAHWFELPFV